MIRDYKNAGRHRSKPHPSRPVKWHWHGAMIFVVAGVLAIVVAQTKKSEASVAPVKKETVELTKLANAAARQQSKWELERYEIALPPTAGKTQAAQNLISSEPSDKDWQSFVVKPGYNLAIICSRAGVKPSELHAIMQLGDSVSVLNSLRPNDIVSMKILPDGTLSALDYDIHQSKRLQVRRVDGPAEGENPFTANIISRPLEVRQAYASGVIDSSLIMAARKVNLDLDITYALMYLFEWDIDFSQEVKKGDHFTVVYEEYYRDGEKIPNNGRNDLYPDKPIIAAEFVNNGKVYRAIRYTDPQGNTDYYSPEGRSIRKAFKRNPIEARISSRFNPKRRHPILNTIRAHKGVDYAAPRGSAIQAVGDGTIVFHGRKGGYGNTLIIQHGQRYSTLYAHMSRFAPNTAKGRKVKQGQVVGYVGQSGLATGPHLHFEFRVDGIHRNPLTIVHPSVEPVPSKYRADFLAKAEERVTQLDTIGRLQLALKKSETSSPHS